MKIVEKWTSSDKTFKVGDVVAYWHKDHRVCGVVTSIEVCDAGDGHVVLDDDPNTLTDFIFVEFDKAHHRNKKLESIGIE